MLKRITISAFALLIALAAVLPSGQWYRCRMDGALHATCCCMISAQDNAPVGIPCSTARGSCCDVVMLSEHPHQQMPSLAASPDDGNSQVLATIEALNQYPAIIGILPVAPLSIERPRMSFPGILPTPPIALRFCISLT